MARAVWTALAVVLAAAIAADFVLTLIEVNGTPKVTTRVIRYFSYFTVESNLLVLAGVLPLGRDPGHDGDLWRVIRLMSLLGITITALVYGVVLAPTSHPQGLHVAINLALHYVSPVMTIGGWLLFGPRPRITGRVVTATLAWPVLWVGYTLWHGAVSGWYPYGFLDVHVHGYGVALRNVGVIVVIALVFLGLFRLLDGRLPPSSGLARRAGS